MIKPGFHIVVSIVSVVRKKFIGRIQLYGNLPYNCSIQQKRPIQLVVRDEFYLSYEFFSYDRYNDMETRLKAVSEPVCLTDRRGKSASRSQNTILLRTHWQKMTEARFKRRTLHVPNLMQMRKIYCFRPFALDSAHVKFDV